MNDTMRRIMKEKVEVFCELEKLPKSVLATIFCYLDFENICCVWMLNKFFFKLICNSNVATAVWRTLCQKITHNFEKDAERKAEEMSKKRGESEPNLFYLLYKEFYFIWDPKQTGVHLTLSKDLKEASMLKNGWSVSKTKRSFAKGVHFAEILVNLIQLFFFTFHVQKDYKHE